jgi:hypothetical protein
MHGCHHHLARIALLTLIVLPTHVTAQHNARPSDSNTVNTPVYRATSSGGFRCGHRVVTLWSGVGGSQYAAFSDDRIWYTVTEPSMMPLLYTAYTLGKKVCYQTKGGPRDNIAINVLFLDPSS